MSQVSGEQEFCDRKFHSSDKEQIASDKSWSGVSNSFALWSVWLFVTAEQNENIKAGLRCSKAPFWYLTLVTLVDVSHMR